ncbi:MAG TPA: acyl-[acyl-carrier-protein]--UDP-N-acetylglucosamine O-acyltransferase, partial [Candidatus Dormibacteraeota bacterium]|nr:acyl-[acyl-carrier-protein]--UDP-N-acetylglucosamine O-acyltransferase [Candidatus Dormibacteraeota bacterium]
MTEPARIHPTAIVEGGAEIGAGTAVGPYSIIGRAVRICPDTEIGAHVVLEGRVT